LLDRYKNIYRFMPVPGGFGASSLDYLLCVGSKFLAIEAKAPGKKPTDRQKMIIGQIRRAGGTVFVIDNVAGTSELEQFLERHHHAPSTSEPEA
jgi:hypothetical protein